MVGMARKLRAIAIGYATPFLVFVLGLHFLSEDEKGFQFGGLLGYGLICVAVIVGICVRIYQRTLSRRGHRLSQVAVGWTHEEWKACGA